RRDMIDLFLETKDVLTEQVSAYRNSQEPDLQAYERICAQLRELALRQKDEVMGAVASTVVAAETGVGAPAVAAPAGSEAQEGVLCISLSRLKPGDVDALAAEMALMGTIRHQEKTADALTVW